ncbi:MAG: hypothetical protein H0Z39_03385 [Peptococcaceae bacterium]|nr:hypothetical protein [Peptococcaceae bacterium]
MSIKNPSFGRRYTADIDDWCDQNAIPRKKETSVYTGTSEVEQAVLNLDLQDGINKLPGEMASAFRLSLAGYSILEIAEKMNLSIEEADQLITEAEERLKEYFKG